VSSPVWTATNRLFTLMRAASTNSRSQDSGVREHVLPAGQRAAPPDDVGGAPDYMEFLAAIQNP